MLTLDSVDIGPGEVHDLRLKMSERYTGAPVRVPVRIARGSEAGPTVLVTSAVHGDELNGVGIARQILFEDLRPDRGTLILVPVVNVLGFEQRSRYLPDRRDLNRSFPGSARGSLTSRFAYEMFQKVAKLADFGVDLHSAAVGRTNFPHVRADLSVPGLRDLAFAFGCEVIVSHPGDRRSFRAAMTRSGRPTILLEGGEALKIEPGVVAIGVRGVHNVLKHLGLLDGNIDRPAYQTSVASTQWLRATGGGILRFHVSPGDIVDPDSDIVSVDNLFTRRSKTVRSNQGGIVLGMPTLPTVKPGDPVCHMAVPERSLDEIRSEIARAPESLHRQVQVAQALPLRGEDS